MKILIDVNLSPDCVQEFKLYQIDSVHWSSVGRFDAPDSEIIDWARENDHIIFTHDLDFGSALALTKSAKPSVIQVGTQNVAVSHLSEMIIPTLTIYADLLTKGALIVIDDDKQRVRILPL